LTEITESAGLRSHIGPEAPSTFEMPDIMGNGAAFVDYDGDGLLDLFLLGGVFDSRSAPRMRNQLFRQMPEGSLTDVSSSAGLEEVEGYGIGIAVGDVDNDGDLDLYLTCLGPDHFLLNNGDGTFTDRSELFETANERWSTAAAFCDYDRDGFLDLFVVNYVDYYPGTQCEEGDLRIDYCGPNSFAGTTCRLYRNLSGADQRGLMFSDVTAESGIAADSGPGLGLVARDFNDDGRLDFYVGNDMRPNRLWIQQSDGTFIDEAVVRGIACNGQGAPQASMGIAWGNLSGQGNCDVFITNLRGEMNILYGGSADGQFTDLTVPSGVGQPSLTRTGFGVIAADLELDGDLDLVLVNGKVKRGSALPGAVLSRHWNQYAEPGQILLSDGRGRFSDASSIAGPIASHVEVSRALAAGDFDNDGDLDFLVTSCGGPARLYRNDAPRRGHWLSVRAFDRALNRDALGAIVFIEAGGAEFRREINPSSSYLASNDFRAYFGTGSAGRFTSLRVRWPDGLEEVFSGGDVDRHLIVYRGTGRALPASN
jgi:hypothetical protein